MIGSNSLFSKGHGPLSWECAWRHLPYRISSPQSSWDHWTLSNPETMAGKNKVRTKPKKTLKSLPPKPKSRKGPGPMENLGTALGYLGGGFLGAPGVGSQIGKYAGRAVGWITGTGDYVTNYGDVTQNACITPNFSGSDFTIISRKEYLCDVVSGSLVGPATGFNVQSYPLNPAQPGSYPWLASIAANYEQYDIMGMVYEFKSTSGDATGVNTSLGSVIMATQYDPTKPIFQSKLEMEDYFFSTTCKPSSSMLHAIECKNTLSPTSGLLYTRSGSLTGTDLRWTDFGKFSIATQGMPNSGTVLGELWVSYKVKLLKPRLPITIGYGGQIASGHTRRTGVVAGSWAGTASLVDEGPLPITLTGTNAITFPCLPQMNYLIVVTVNAATSVGAFNFGAKINLDTLDAGVSGATSTSNTLYTLVQYNGLNAGFGSINCGTGSGITGAATCDVYVTQVDETVKL